MSEPTGLFELSELSLGDHAHGENETATGTDIAARALSAYRSAVDIGQLGWCPDGSCEACR
jgi:hypothetical protein